MKQKNLKDYETNDARTKKMKTSWSVRLIIDRPFVSLKIRKKFFVMLMGHQIIEIRMLCTVNLFFSFKADKNIRKLIILFSSLYVDFELWCDFFCWKHCLAGSIKSFWVWLLFTTVFKIRNITQRVILCNFVMCILGKHSARMFFNECVPKIFQ